MPDLRQGARGAYRRLWEGLTHPGYPTFRFKSASTGETDPEFIGLNDAHVAQQVTNDRVWVFGDRTYEGALTSPVGIAILAGIGGQVAGWQRALAWAAVFAILEIVALRAGYRCRQSAPRGLDALEQARWLVVLSFLTGLGWGSSAWVFWTEGHFDAYLLNIVCLVGIAGLSLLIMSPFFGAMAAFYAGSILLPALYTLTLPHPLAWKLGVSMMVYYYLLLQFGSAVGLHLMKHVESRVRSRLLAERLRLALGAARQDWFDLSLASGEMISSNRHVGPAPGAAQDGRHGHREWLARIHPDDRPAAELAFGDALRDSDAGVVEYRTLQARGSWSWVRSIGRVVDRGPDGQVRRVIGVHADISAAKAHEETIERLAFRDQLTDLPNRRLMSDRLQQAMASALRQQRSGALLLLDMDDFKSLNDTLGHDVGDQFLREVARRLRHGFRARDMVARQGGDEFTVLLENLDNGPQAVTQVEAAASKVLQALREPYTLELAAVAGQRQIHKYSCTASIGAALFGDEPCTVEELYKRADTAMYQAKAEGRNTIRFFDPAMQAEVVERAGLANELRQAVLEGQFVLYFQPQVDAGGRVRGCEALLRWRHPTRGIVTPDHFIGVAESMGMIQAIGRWGIETACAQLVAWSGRPQTSHLTLSVNVSAAQFRDKEFIGQTLAVLERTGAAARRLKLEITESVAMHNVEEVIEKMSRLRSAGIGFALDDFGTGYSSLACLRRLPIGQLKIDRSFVRDVLTDPNDAAIARTIIALAEVMNLEVIAEGVETEGHRRFLADHGCRGFQGYLFARPMPIERFDEYMGLARPQPPGAAVRGPLLTA